MSVLVRVLRSNGKDAMTDTASEDHPHILGSGTRGGIDTGRDSSRWKKVSTRVSCDGSSCNMFASSFRWTVVPRLFELFK